jgi:hypothetical protein
MRQSPDPAQPDTLQQRPHNPEEFSPNCLSGTISVQRVHSAPPYRNTSRQFRAHAAAQSNPLPAVACSPATRAVVVSQRIIVPQPRMRHKGAARTAQQQDQPPRWCSEWAHGHVGSAREVEREWEGWKQPALHTVPTVATPVKAEPVRPVQNRKAQSRNAVCSHAALVDDSESQACRHPGWDARGTSSMNVFPATIWDKPAPPPYVHVVNNVAEAKRVMQLLRLLVEEDKQVAGIRDDYGRQFWSRRIFACDTEVRAPERNARSTLQRPRVRP